MPEPDLPSIIINAESGYTRTNHNWVLGRILRDFDYWKPNQVRDVLKQILDDARRADVENAKKKGIEPPPPRERAGLCISIFCTIPIPTGVTPHPAGRNVNTPTRDWVFYSGILCAIIQLAIASIPCALYGQWPTLMITGWGILLAFACGLFPQWKAEKWHGRHRAKGVALTRGNGAQDVIVIISDEHGLDLEDLAGLGEVETSLLTRILATLVAIQWMALLITVGGIDENTWYLLAVGAVGMVQNSVVAGASRKPGSFGLHLDLKSVEVIGDAKVMEALKKAEDRHPRLGASLLNTFFPGNLREDEKKYWNQKAKEWEERKKPSKS